MLTTERIDALLEEVRPRLPPYVQRLWGTHRLDRDGDPYIDAYIVIADKAATRFLKRRDGQGIDDAIRDHFLNAGIEDFVVTTYRTTSDQKWIEREEAAERRAALPRKRRRPTRRKRA